MIREFLTYFPLWLPVKSRQQLLRDSLSTYWAEHLLRLMLGKDPEVSLLTAPPDDPDNKRLDRAWLLYAYAMARPDAFLNDETAWQTAFAKRVTEVVRRDLLEGGNSWSELLGLDFTFTGMHEPSHLLRFNWCEIQGHVNTDKLWMFLQDRMRSMENIYARRWLDKRYRFATKKTCPIPRSVDDLDSMDAFKLGLALELPMKAITNHWRLSNARQVYAAGIMPAVDSDQPAADWLKGAMLLKPALRAAVEDQDPNHVILDKMLEVALSEYSSWLRHPYQLIWQSELPATVMETLDTLKEAQCDTTPETARGDS